MQVNEVSTAEAETNSKRQTHLRSKAILRAEREAEVLALMQSVTFHHPKLAE